MDKAFEELRKLSIRTYSLWFGSIFGYTVFNHTSYGVIKNTGSLYVWLLMGFVGSILVVMKNAKITNSKLRFWIMTADLLVLLALIILINILPAFLGLLRGLIVLIVSLIYIIVYFKLLFKGKLLEGDDSTR